MQTQQRNKETNTPAEQFNFTQRFSSSVKLFAMIVVLLVGYVHGRRRKEMSRDRMQLPSAIQEMCIQSSIDVTLQSKAKNLTDSTPILGIARCKPGNLSSGPLVPWTREERLLFEYFGEQCHARCYSLVVVDVWLLQGHWPTHSSMKKLRFSSGSSRVDLNTLRQQVLYPADNWASGVNVMLCLPATDLLQRWGIAPCHGNRLSLVPVVLPLASLIIKKEWSTILLPAEWHGSMRKGRCPQPFQLAWPSAEWFSSGMASKPAAEVTEAFSADLLDLFAERLVTWGDKIIADSDFGAKEELSEMISTLQRSSASLRPESHVERSKGGQTEIQKRRKREKANKEANLETNTEATNTNTHKAVLPISATRLSSSCSLCDSLDVCVIGAA